MNARSQHARALLESIAHKLTRGETIKLNSEEHSYLSDACRKALDGTDDPLSIGKAPGGQSLNDDGIGEAKLVHRRRKELGTLRAACEAVGAELFRDGSKSGAVEKNYKRHRAALEATDRFYTAKKSGAEIDADDVALILKAKGK